MRKSNEILISLLVASTAYFSNSCNHEPDYSSITYRNYLGYQIEQAESVLSEQTEGTAEGEYEAGSMQAYQQSIDESKSVYENPESDQKEIDQAYEELIKAGDDFYDQMNPYVSNFQEVIGYAEFTLDHTEEGQAEGQVKPGSKEILQNEIDKANNILADPELVQRMIDEESPALLTAVYTFDGNINGKGLVYSENSGFEMPGFNTINFDEVPGWTTFGKLETWALKTEIYQGGTDLLPAESVPEGLFVCKLGSYTQGIYQPLIERVHPGVKYTLNMKASVLMNNPDAFGVRHKVIVQSRVFSFEQEEGDYKFISLINVSYDTLGLDPTGFLELNNSFEISNTSEFIDSKIAVDFMVRHTFDPANPIWAESYVAIDDIKLFRQ